MPTSEKPQGIVFLQLAHYHAKTPCLLHGASPYFRHHSSFEIVCGSAFVNGCERTKLCHPAVGLYPSQPISRLAHYSYFPTNLLSIEIGSICQIGACVVGIYPTASPTDCATSIIVREPNLLLGRDQIREYQGIWKIEQVAGSVGHALPHRIAGSLGHTTLKLNKALFG